MQFTAKNVLDEAIRIAKDNPDFVYRAQDNGGEDMFCGYAGKAHDTLDGTPCIVGSALISLGVERKDLLYNTANAYTVVGNLAVDGTHDKDSLNILKFIQLEQDNGKSWGEAFESAEEVLKVSLL